MRHWKRKGEDLILSGNVRVPMDSITNVRLWQTDEGLVSDTTVDIGVGIRPSSGDPELRIQIDKNYAPEAAKELGDFVRHRPPKDGTCEKNIFSCPTERR